MNVVNNIEIHRASASSLEQINGVIVESKKYWNYPRAYLDLALPLLMVNEAYLSESLSFEIQIDKKIVGFFALTTKDLEKHLDHLWIVPNCIGLGIGKVACAYIFDLCQRLGWKEIVTYPDPPAEGFYSKQGFLDTGESVPSRVIGGPTFSLFKKILEF